MGSTDEKTSITDQIAAEAAHKLTGDTEGAAYSAAFQTVKSAIEKAMGDWKAANDVLRAENRGLFAKCEALEEANSKFEVVILEGEQAVNSALLEENRQLRAAQAGDASRPCGCECPFHNPAHASETKRLDWLEATVRNEGGELNIHNDMKSRDCLGLTIQNRSLREAIDAAMQREKP